MTKNKEEQTSECIFFQLVCANVLQVCTPDLHNLLNVRVPRSKAIPRTQKVLYIRTEILYTRDVSRRV